MFEFELINQQTENSMNSSEGTMGVIERLTQSVFKKHETSYAFFTSLLELTQHLTKGFHELVLSQQKSGDHSGKSLSKKESTEAASLIENKQPIQIFCNLIDLVSILFTRVKSHQILSQFLVQFAVAIELITELNSISKMTPACGSEASPAAKKTSRSLGFKTPHPNLVDNLSNINFQSTRHSNELYDKLSMQIASYIQNHLSKSFSNHQFDSVLLAKLEPIFYSFLKYSNKLSLKQKTLQAWNSTFGKSTLDSLVYSPRLEAIFVEIRDEMTSSSSVSRLSCGAAGGGISGGGGGGGLKNNMGLIAISLPGFKSIDLLQQTNLTNSFMNEIDDYLLNEEKENTPENMNNADAAKKDDANNKTPLLSTSKSKEFLNEASCSSVPVALLVSSNKASPSFAVSNATISLQKTPIMEKTSLSAKKSAQTKKNESLTDKSSNLEGNFCFSGASGLSSSTSKLNSNLMKTPDASSLGVRSSPRSLKNNNSKRKLDLNVFQIDQMPDKDFVEINEKCPKDSIVSMEDLNQVENKKSLFKKPLTEHQKEVRKKKSFIPMEIQSVCSVLEPTMDSQMSCTNDTFAADDSIVNSQFAKPAMNETSNALIQFSLNSLGKPAEPPAQQEMECEHSEETKLVHKDDEDYLIANTDMLVSNEATVAAAANPLPLQSIKFQSKMNPNKKIDLVEVKNETIPAVTVIEKPAVEVAAVEPSVEEEKTISQEAVTDPNETEEKLSQIDSSQRRRSARLKSKEVPTSTPGNDEPVEPILLSQISSSSANTSTGSMEFTVTNVGENITVLASQLETKLETPVINSEEILEKLNEECKLMKTIKMKIKSNKTRLKAGGGQPGVTKLLKINHQLGQGKIVKKTFKSYQQKLNFAKKQKKYRKLIKGIKQSTNKAEKKLKKIEKKALVNNLNSLLVEETHVAEVSLKENAVEVKQHDIYEFVDNEVKKEVTIADEDDDDEKPLMALIKKETPKVAEAVVEPIEAVKLPEEPVKTIQMEVEAPKPHKKLTDIIEGESSPPSTPTAPSKRDLANTLLAEALGTSPSTAALIQKLNDTPTTSILKKKLTESKVSHSAVKHLTYGNGDSGTPNKRRVSFCEAVQIEEIEPNANKSLFNRSTPKPRAKLVLTSYFNNKQITSPAMVGNSISTIHAHSSSSTTMSAVTVISNAQTYESKLNCSLNSAMNNMSPKVCSKLIKIFS